MRELSKSTRQTFSIITLVGVAFLFLIVTFGLIKFIGSISGASDPYQLRLLLQSLFGYLITYSFIVITFLSALIVFPNTETPSLKIRFGLLISGLSLGAVVLLRSITSIITFVLYINLINSDYIYILLSIFEFFVLILIFVIYLRYTYDLLISKK